MTKRLILIVQSATFSTRHPPRCVTATAKVVAMDQVAKNRAATFKSLHAAVLRPGVVWLPRMDDERIGRQVAPLIQQQLQCRLPTTSHRNCARPTSECVNTCLPLSSVFLLCLFLSLSSCMQSVRCARLALVFLRHPSLSAAKRLGIQRHYRRCIKAVFILSLSYCCIKVEGSMLQHPDPQWGGDPKLSLIHI